MSEVSLVTLRIGTTTSINYIIKYICAFLLPPQAWCGRGEGCLDVLICFNILIKLIGESPSIKASWETEKWSNNLKTWYVFLKKYCSFFNIFYFVREEVVWDFLYLCNFHYDLNKYTFFPQWKHFCDVWSITHKIISWCRVLGEISTL